jgi:hypothetical protein
MRALGTGGRARVRDRLEVEACEWEVAVEGGDSEELPATEPGPAAPLPMPFMSAALLIYGSEPGVTLARPNVELDMIREVWGFCAGSLTH